MFILSADDFVITAISKEVITNDIIPLVTEFLIERGLELSPEKSKITHIIDGFNFLSRNVCKFKGKLIIRPSKESVQSFKEKIKTIIDENRGIPAHALIQILNPIIRGWAKYQHGNKNRWWIFHRYFLDNHFTDQRITKNGTEQHRLYRIGYVPIRYHVKVKANSFLPEYDQYFYNSTIWKANQPKECKQITTFMSNKESNDSRVALQLVSLKSA